MGGGRSGGKKFIKTLKKNTIFENNELKIVHKKIDIFWIFQDKEEGEGVYLNYCLLKTNMSTI